MTTPQAGAAAAFTIDLLVYPLDTIKTRYQSQDYLKTFTGRGVRQSRAAVFRGLYQGVGSVIVATLPAGALPGIYSTRSRHIVQMHTLTN